MVELSDAIIGELLEEDIGAISQQFEGMFANCIRTGSQSFSFSFSFFS